MALKDNIHQGTIEFKDDAFILLYFNFIGNLLQNDEIISRDINVEGKYNITGSIEINILANDFFSIIENNNFIHYEIKGEDENYEYYVDKIFFRSCPHRYLSPDKKYTGTTNSYIRITQKIKQDINVVVCDCLCGKFPYLVDNFIIENRDICFSQNRNYWKNKPLLQKIFKNILGVTFQYSVKNSINIDEEINLYDKIEYLFCFLTGHDFGISICKFINSYCNNIVEYVIRDRHSNCNGEYYFLDDDTPKIKKFIESTSIWDCIDKDYYKETINFLAKLHNESDIHIKWAILIIAFEKFLKNILLENGESEDDLKEKSIIDKLRMYNKLIKMIPKRYFNDKLIRQYRNPLLHSGEIFEDNIDELIQFFNIYQDLLYELICKSVDYNGPILLRSMYSVFDNLLKKNST
jgi:hypothetical protein